MTTKLNCAVCAYTDIDGNICPNCATDLSLIRMLQQLPQIRSCPDEDLWLTQGTRGADEEAETRIRFYDQQLGHELEAEGVIGGYSSAIQDYLFRDLMGAVCNLFAQGGKLYGLLKISIWLGVTLFILTVGIGLGVVGCFLYFNPPATSAQDDSWLYLGNLITMTVGNLQCCTGSSRLKTFKGEGLLWKFLMFLAK